MSQEWGSEVLSLEVWCLALCCHAGKSALQYFNSQNWLFSFIYIYSGILNQILRSSP